jgi:hypothetical protein
MAIQLGTTLRNNKANQYEATIGASPKLQIRTGAQPSNCAAADTGTLLCELTLPSDWMNAASSGSVTLLGTWAGAGASAGTAAHYRLKDNAATVCHEQGSITATGGGGDLELTTVVVGVASPVSVTTWTRTEANA